MASPLSARGTHGLRHGAVSLAVCGQLERVYGWHFSFQQCRANAAS